MVQLFGRAVDRHSRAAMAAYQLYRLWPIPYMGSGSLGNSRLLDVEDAVEVVDAWAGPASTTSTAKTLTARAHVSLLRCTSTVESNLTSLLHLEVASRLRSSLRIGDTGYVNTDRYRCPPIPIPVLGMQSRSKGDDRGELA